MGEMCIRDSSKGYQTRPSYSVEEIGELISFIKEIAPGVICMVDNCYGEFVERIEPSDVGADMVVGSLIKNPGGGLAPIGGYIAGKRDLIENCAYRLTLSLIHIYPRDLTAFRSSLEMLPPVKYIMEEMKGELLSDIRGEIDTLEDLCSLVKASITEEPPIAMKEGGIIREGYSEEVDNLRRAKSEGKEWLAKLENEEREKTGIKNLRIRYNKVRCV